MDWRSVKFDWNRARAFLVTAEEGSLSAAARALGLAQPTLGRQVAALEQELGVVLFERIGRNLKLTENGLDLVEHVRAMGDAATRVSLAASGQSQSIEGNVRITATEMFSTFVLPDIVADLRRQQPGIRLEIVASDNVSDLRRREADIAIRNTQPTDSELIARKIRDENACLYAAHSYLDGRKTRIATKADLETCAFIGFDDNEALVKGLRGIGLDLSQGHFPVLANSHLVHWELVKRGLGIGIMMTPVGDAAPEVRRAAPWLAPFVFPVWLVTHREVNTSPRIRIVFDMLAEALGKRLHGRPSGTSEIRKV